MKENLIEKYKWIKDNLSLILVIPTLIGGLWQLIELSSISIAYIRFFSITQVIPDGLLILFTISLLISSYYFGGVVIKWTPFYKAKLTSWKSAIIISILILFVFTMSGHELYKSITQIGYIRVSDIVFIVFSLTFLLGILLHLIPYKAKMKLIESQENKESAKKLNEDKKEISRWKKNLITLLVFGFVVLGFYIIKFTFTIISDLRTSYISTENLINIENLKTEISKNETDKSFEKILYFNDKYFFIQLKDADSKEYIRVLKTETMFEPK